MKKKEKRQTLILDVLSQHEKCEVNELARLCQVSLVTIRKDLTELEQKNLLRREQGYAIMNDENDMQKRLITNHLIKRRIARAAGSLVRDGDTVMIESGSCCILLAEELCRSRSNLTIITNSVFMAEYLGKMPNLRLVLLGGDYQPESQAVVGPVTRLCAEAFHVNRIFIGTDGYQADTGFTGDNHIRVETLRNMAARADEIVIVTESMKFLKPGVVSLCPLDEIAHLVTDAGIPAEAAAVMKKHGINLILAENE